MSKVSCQIEHVANAASTSDHAVVFLVMHGKLNECMCCRDEMWRLCQQGKANTGGSCKRDTGTVGVAFAEAQQQPLGYFAAILSPPCHV